MRYALLTLLAAGLGAQDVQSLLAAKCQMCHNDKSRSGGLSLATIDGIRTGGERGPAIVPGKPSESLLYRLISGEQPAMPFQGQALNQAEVDSVRLWIEQGAPWTQPAKWWSLVPLRRPPVPHIKDAWIQTPVDSFVLAKLREKGLRPSAEADRRTLIRRLTYDLHGLPPSPEEVDAFVADRSPDAYEKLVDRLLASPRYGERWGRHWLDVAHYGESHGYDKDKPRRNAWPYRDYVIRAFNDDKPYTRFVEEQLAGDTLFPDNPDATVALGFIAAGPWDFVGQAELAKGTTDKNITRLLDRDDMVAQTVSALVSTTAHCARCHDHKFDAIRQSEYYSLQAVFAGVDRADRPFDRDPAVFKARNGLLVKKRVLAAALRPLEKEEAETSTTEIAALDKRVAEWKQVDATDPAKRPPEIQKKIADAAVERRAMVRAALAPSIRGELDRLRAEIASVDREIKSLPKPEWVYAAANYFEPQGTFRFAIEPRAVNVLLRGSVDNPGAVASPGALSLVEGLKPVFASSLTAPEGERRADLARWITNPGAVMASPWEWKPHGQCGKWISGLTPHLASCADDLAFVHSMISKSNVHGPATFMQNTGFVLPGFPSMGAWVSYGLGSMNNNLPTFVVLPDSRGFAPNGASNWSAGFLPAAHQGIMIRASSANPIYDLFPPKSASYITPDSEADSLRTLHQMNEEHLESRSGDSRLEARIASYELAAKLQTSAPEVMDLSKESAATRALYGIDDPVTQDFGRNCLVARRMLERGVRFVQVWSGADNGFPRRNWDSHEDLAKDHGEMAAGMDRPAAALIKDLKSRGMLEETIVHWATEFGRMPCSQGSKGRDNNPFAFTTFFAGGGFKGGASYGASDEWSYKVAEKPAYCYDLHATMLHLLGIDHKRLTYRHNGIDRRITDVFGEVIREII